jgi:uncharacterized membrane protein
MNLADMSNVHLPIFQDFFPFIRLSLIPVSGVFPTKGGFRTPKSQIENHKS